MSWMDAVRFDERGLVPVIAQEAETNAVLMLAYANREALQRTVKTGFAHYWSRSRAELWQKGATSGHVQAVVEVRLDCDGDAVLYQVRQQGPACHTGTRTCFGSRLRDQVWEDAADAADSRHILSRVEDLLRARQTELPQGSYTTYLFGAGLDKILKKVGEESTETVIAAKNGDRNPLLAEVADLLFHLLVLLRHQDIEIAEVWAELEGRFGTRPTSYGPAGKKRQAEAMRGLDAPLADEHPDRAAG